MLRRRVLLGMVAVALCGAAFAVSLFAGGLPAVTIATGAQGIESVKSDRVEFLQSGQFRVDEVLLKNAGAARLARARSPEHKPSMR
jgi:hypothetical protein